MELLISVLLWLGQFVFDFVVLAFWSSGSTGSSRHDEAVRAIGWVIAAGLLCLVAIVAAVALFRG